MDSASSDGATQVTRKPSSCTSRLRLAGVRASTTVVVASLVLGFGSCPSRR